MLVRRRDFAGTHASLFVGDSLVAFVSSQRVVDMVSQTCCPQAALICLLSYVQPRVPGHRQRRRL
jgi:hypothetical protein